ncbi:MAG TPA: SulP family inorganic anion transporter [Steroidobacteraceae bacterium]|nr:SulP family inorganic anion transporter [Steroidobacteraceae bacterium]
MTATPRYSSGDLIAGLAIAGLLLPEAVAYAGLAGLPPAAGVMGMFAGLLCYGLIGQSAYAIVTPTSSSAAVLAAATLALVGADAPLRIAYASLLVTGAGIAFLLAGAARFGAISNLIARPVLRGYAFGLALVIIVKQWPHLVAVPVSGSGFFGVLLEELRSAAAWHRASLMLGLGALLVLFALARIRHVPASLIVIVAGVLASPWLAARGVALIGPLRLERALGAWQRPAGHQWLPIVEYSLALLFIVYAESYSSIRTFSLKHAQPMQPNRDLIALGVANVVAGLVHGTPVGAGYSGTSANEAAGAQSRFAGLTAAALLLIAVWLLVPWIERIPEPVLAAIVIHAVSRSLRPSVFRPYWRWQRDRGVSLMAVAAVLFFGVLNGLLAAIAFSLAVLLRSLASPRLSELGRWGEHDFVSIARYPRAEVLTGVLILRPEEPLLFANVDPLLSLARHAVRAHPDTHLVILSLEESPDLDGTCLESLAEFEAWLGLHRIELRFARLKERAREALMRARDAHRSAADLDYSSVDDAVRGLPAPSDKPRELA